MNPDQNTNLNVTSPWRQIHAQPLHCSTTSIPWSLKTHHNNNSIANAFVPRCNCFLFCHSSRQFTISNFNFSFRMPERKYPGTYRTLITAPYTVTRLGSDTSPPAKGRAVTCKFWHNVWPSPKICEIRSTYLLHSHLYNPRESLSAQCTCLLLCFCGPEWKYLSQTLSGKMLLLHVSSTPRNLLVLVEFLWYRKIIRNSCSDVGLRRRHEVTE